MKNILIRNTRDPLFSFSREEVEDYLKTALRGRAEAAYLFGSFVRDELCPESDIDVMIVTETDLSFPVRGRIFEDLRDRLPSLEILVYTPAEFASLTADPSPGFWSSAAADMVRLF
jgi:predicted nucleotidyltransferase